MRLAFVMVLMVAGLAPPAVAAGPPLAVDRGPVYATEGQIVVRVACRARRCRSTIRATGRAARVNLLAGEASFVRVPAGGVGRRVTLRVRSAGRTARVRRPVRHRRDVRRCGFGEYAERIAGGDRALILRVREGGEDDAAEDAEIVACADGAIRPLADESSAQFAPVSVAAAAVTDDWAAVAMRTTNPRADSSDLVLWSRPMRTPGGLRGVSLERGALGIGPEVVRLLIAPDGAIALGLDQGDTASIRKVDGAGRRTLDDGAGVDATTLTLSGQTASWVRDGAAQSAVLAGPPRR